MPQLVNILIGEMSLVGPRPALLSQQDLISLRLKNNVLLLRPGLTGLAQINSFDGMSIQNKLKLDVKYLHNISFFLDISIILKTFVYVLKPPPVY